MVKPPRSMQPDFAVEDSEDDERQKKKSHRGMEEDSFRNYMSRKIKLQREQFGIENHLPPPPTPNVNASYKKIRVAPEKDECRSKSSKADDFTPERSREKNSASMNEVIRSLKEKERQRRRRKRKRNDSATDSIPPPVSISSPSLRQRTNVDRADNQHAVKYRPDLFLRGVIVLVNGYTHPDADTLKRLLHRHGGDLEKYETFRVTHIIATNLSFAKAKIYRQQRKPIPVVRPEWIVDCVDQKMKLPHAPYLIDEVKEKGNKSIAKLFGVAKMREEQIRMNDITHTSIENPIMKSPHLEALSCSQVVESQHSTPMPSRSYNTPDLTQRASSSRKDSSSPRHSRLSQNSDQMVENLPYSKFEIDSPRIGQQPLTQCSNFYDRETSPLTMRQIQNNEEEERSDPSNQSTTLQHKLSQIHQTRGVIDSSIPSSDRVVKTSSFDGSPHSLETDKSIGQSSSNEQDSALNFNRKQTTNATRFEFPTTKDQHVIDCKKDIMEDAPQSPSETAVLKGKPDSKYINGRLRTTGTDPDFLKSFFSNSRLSFIGSYQQRAQMSPLKQKKCTASRSVSKPLKVQRFVFHIDMDCFFAAVVLRKYPQYKGKPVAISHNGSKSVDTDGASTGVSKSSSSECATCNYEARKFGIKKGMFLGRARALCPQLIVLDYDFLGYEEVSQQVASILDRHVAENQATGVSPALEQVSCDESYLELHLIKDNQNARNEYEIAKSIAQLIRKEIEAVTQCTASIGVGPNKLLAKLGTDKVKPDGLYIVEDFHELLQPLKLRELHGVGYRSDEKLIAEGLITVKDVWDLGTRAESELCRILGEATGKKLLSFCYGKDDREVKAAERKTIGAECNYGVRFDGPYGVQHMMNGLADEVEQRMVGVGVWGGKMTLKVKQRKKDAKPPPKFLGHGSCRNLSKSIDFPGKNPTNDRNIFVQYGMQLLRELAVPAEDIRGMGIVISKLSRHMPSPKSDLNGLSTWLQPGSWEDLHEKKEKKDEGKKKENRYSVSSGSTTLNKAEEELELRFKPINLATEESSVTGSPIDMDNDYVLPPPSQIDMSQVNALPSPLRHHIVSRLQSHNTNSTISVDNTPRFDQKEIDEESIGNHRWKQTSVKHHFHLAAVKSGKDNLPGALEGENISVTQLECLPIDMQLQIANNGQIKSPLISTITRQRGTLASKTCAYTNSNQLYQRRTTAADLESPSPEPFLPSSAKNVVDNKMTTETVGRGSSSFYRENIAPLHSFLDENSPDDEEAINKVIEFLTQCANQWRLCDVITLLRSIRNRSDCWKDCAYSKILKQMDETARKLTGCNLDTPWLSL